MPPGGNPVKVSAIDVVPGFGEQRPPFAGVGGWERSPLAKAAAVGREGQCLTGGDQLADPVGGKLDDKVPSGSFDAREESAFARRQGYPIMVPWVTPGSARNCCASSQNRVSRALASALFTAVSPGFRQR